MKNFLVYQPIVSDGQEGVSPMQFRDFLASLDEGEAFEVEINSPGGNVTDGITIAQLIRSASAQKHRSYAKIRGLAASIASVIACACDEIQMSKGSMLMLHECWGQVEGNKTQLKHEIETMEKMDKVILSFYVGKFEQSEEELKAMMEAETWMTAEEAMVQYGLKATYDETEYSLAARCDISKMNFKNIPEGFKKNMDIADKVVKDDKKELEKLEQEQPAEQQEQPAEEEKQDVEVPEEKEPDKQDEEPAEEEEQPKDEDDDDEDFIDGELKAVLEENERLKKKIEELEEELGKCKGGEVVTKEEADKRVAGMQSTMAKQVNVFKDELKAREQELTKFKDEVTSLKNALEKSAKELSEKTSALMEKTQALDMLNANVNLPNGEVLPTFKDGLARCNSPKERVDFIASGKYLK